MNEEMKGLGDIPKSTNDAPYDFLAVSVGGLEGLDVHGYFLLPETATLKQIKDFQQQSEAMLAELKNDIFKDS